jgi:hypothetical protein
MSTPAKAAVRSEMLSTAAWIDIAVGAVIGVYAIVRFTKSRTRPEVAGRYVGRQPGRPLYEAGFSLILIASGVSLLAGHSGQTAIQWAGSVISCVAVAWIIVTWLRERMRHVPEDQRSRPI